MTDIQAAEWNAAVRELPGAHILQTWEWAQFKAHYGWKPLPQLWRDEQGKVRAAAMVLRRAAPGGLNMLYVPRGPLVDWQDKQWSRLAVERLQDLAKQQRSIFIKMDPERMLGSGQPGTADDLAEPGAEEFLTDLRARGWRFSEEQVQFRNTVLIDLHGDEADWLVRMKQKARYNIRLAERKGVSVRSGTPADLHLLYTMYAETSVRDHFVIRDESYYNRLWRDFMERGLAEPLIAEVDGQPVGAIMLFTFAGRAWYLYGMSRDMHREKMPNYLLQWEAMRRAKARGCIQYDLWGAPDTFDEHDPLWGVFRFKEGLGGRVARTTGAWDYPARPVFYLLYTRLLPRLMDVLRRRGRARTEQEVSL